MNDFLADGIWLSCHVWWKLTMGVMEVDVPLLMFGVWLPVLIFLSRNSNTFRYE